TEDTARWQLCGPLRQVGERYTKAPADGITSEPAAAGCAGVGADVHERCRAAAARAVRVVPSAGRRWSVQPRLVRRCAAAGAPDRPGAAEALQAAVEA